MNVSYQPLWNILKDKKMKKKELIELASISENCVANMGSNKYISMKNISRICKALSCTPNDVFTFNNEYVENDKIKYDSKK